MRRYVRAPLKSEWDDEPFLPSLSVFEADATPRKTGLFDKDGIELYAVDDREPIGFVRPKA